MAVRSLSGPHRPASQTVYRDLVASGGVPSVSPAAAYGKRKR
jgi:hypothetical protein